MEWFLRIVGVCLICWISYKVYKNIEEKKKAQYDQALKCLNKGDYDDAIKGFSLLVGFLDSAGKLKKAKNQKCDSVFKSINSSIARFDNGAKCLLGFESNLTVKPDDDILYFSDSPKKTAYVSCDRAIAACRDSFEASTAQFNKIKPLAEEMGIQFDSFTNELADEASLLPFLEYFANNLNCTLDTYMMANPLIDYGKPNIDFLNSVKRLEMDIALRSVSCIKKAQTAKVNLDDYAILCAFEPFWLIGIAWKLAMTSPFQSKEFDSITKSVDRTLRARFGSSGHFDTVLARLYAQYSIAGEDIICDSLRRDLGKEPYRAEKCMYLASFFMWIDASKAETMVLEYMLSNGLNMTPKMQERLHTLKMTGGKNAKLHQVESTDAVLYFDTSSVGWDIKALQGFFADLEFREQIPAYSLALREAENTLTLPHGRTAPSINSIHEKLNKSLLEEYADEVKVDLMQCIAMAGNSEEQFDGVLVSTNACDHLGVLIFTIPVGKKLTIKQYTLYMPTDKAAKLQTLDAEGLLEQTSPITKVWESSLKQNALDAIEAVLNEQREPNVINGNERTATEVMF